MAWRLPCEQSLAHQEALALGIHPCVASKQVYAHMRREETHIMIKDEVLISKCISWLTAAGNGAGPEGIMGL